MISLTRTSHRAARTPEPPTRICGEADYREVPHESALGSIVNSSVAGHSQMPSGYEPAIQVVLPYFGLFAYSVGSERWLIDPASVLLIKPGWEYRDEQPVEGLGHACLLLNPSETIVDEILRGRSDAGVPAFGAAQSSPALWLLSQSFLSEAISGLTTLQGDEWMIRVLAMAFDRPPINARPSSSTIARAKEFLHAHPFEKLSLERVASAVGVSPVYLTQEFTRSEGVPLYQYQLGLRLARALHDLRDCEDITQLALELGFSSHSHFSAKFRQTFGLSPSQVRGKVRHRRSEQGFVARQMKRAEQRSA